MSEKTLVITDQDRPDASRYTCKQKWASVFL